MTAVALGAIPGAAAAGPYEEARTWTAGRAGDVTWAVVDARGTVHHHRGTRTFASASVTKALLLVAVLRRRAGRELTPDERALLGPLIRRSSNRAGSVLHARVGDAGLAEVARAARMRRVGLNGTWSEVRLCAVDVARFFAALDRVVPPGHRAYARGLLGSLVPTQDWGLPGALEPRGWRVLAKGGWRAKLVHQGGLAERGGRRLALAILTDRSPTHEYGRGTVEGLARRLAGPGA
jgi:hypothetical protein